MAGFHGLTVDQIRHRLEKKFEPAFKESIKIAVELAAEHLRKSLDIAHSSILYRPGLNKNSSKPGQYPRKRTGSLQASVGTTKLVTHQNVYSRSFGIVKDVLLGKIKAQAAKTAKRRKTLFAAHEEKTASYLSRGGRRVPGAFGEPAMTHKPTLYAKYLEGGFRGQGPRKLTRAAWNEIKYSGKLRAALKAGLKGTGSRIVSGGKLPTAK